MVKFFVWMFAVTGSLCVLSLSVWEWAGTETQVGIAWGLLALLVGSIVSGVYSVIRNDQVLWPIPYLLVATAFVIIVAEYGRVRTQQSIIYGDGLHKVEVCTTDHHGELFCQSGR